MGCTSSAPNMADIQTNATEETKVQKDNEIDKMNSENNVDIKFERKNNIEALPSCDTFTENIQLASNSNSTDTNHDMEGKVNDLDGNAPLEFKIYDNQNGQENKITSFKEVADIVIVNEILEHTRIKDINGLPSNEECVDENIPTESVEVDEPCNPEIVTSSLEEIEITEEDSKLNEHVSPSQSECSRSTRWEALADIAAELPPSLAVDPVTGQIYTLSK
ncbi:uncharacterized protein LOC123694316 [Colias croceus]|uniref:uncharacterized protein LOC123694316 n=1 Tax=Colias crocea TaxID=72248 RepID=UPI001E27B5D8|nr:uncharacterized protein LOC123694316 [Colias croceus]